MIGQHVRRHTFLNICILYIVLIALHPFYPMAFVEIFFVLVQLIAYGLWALFAFICGKYKSYSPNLIPSDNNAVVFQKWCLKQVENEQSTFQ